ncbi:MAG: hypothetical protein HN348_20795, partial [Proteobacteria bacterium]|nr:hypothetical protein [Pseudomonadota bacterium]
MSRFSFIALCAIPILVGSCKSGSQGVGSIDLDDPSLCTIEDELAPNSSQPTAHFIDMEANRGEVWEMEGLFLCPGDSDWFSFYVEAGQHLFAELYFLQEKGDLNLELVDEKARPMVLGASNTDNEYLDLEVTVSQNYFLRVYGADEYQDNMYEMSLGIVGEPCLPDALEPNDGYDTATEITLAETHELNLCYADRDWFAFSAEHGQLISAELSFIHGEDNDLGLQLYKVLEDQSVSYRAAADTLDDNETIQYTAFESGEYLFQVYGSRGTTEVEYYEFLVDVTGDICIEDSYEPNDSEAEAQPVAEGAHADMTLCVGDNDWYTIDVANGQTLSVDIGFTHLDNDLGLSLYELNADGSLTFRTTADTLTDDESVLYQPFSETTLVVEVFRNSGQIDAAYTMDVSISGEPCIEDDYEPNDGYPEAVKLPKKGEQEMTLCVGDEDWFSFNADNGQVISVFIEFLHSEADLGMQLWQLNGDGTLTYRSGADTLTDNEEVTYQPFEDGTFLINVYQTNGTDPAEYIVDLTVSGDSCVEDSFEPNNAYQEAQEIEIDSHNDLSLCVGDEDWYIVEIMNGQVFSADLTFSHADNDLGVRLYQQNEDGTVTYRAGADTLTDNEQLIYQPYEDGTFLLNIYRSRGTTVADYDLELEISGDPCVPDAFEPNNGAGEAVELADGDYPDMTLCVGDSDWYSTELANGQILDVAANFDHDENDLGMAVYKLNDDGTTSYRAGSNTLTNDERIIYQPYDDGTFLVYVYRTRGTTIALYSLDVSVTGDPCVADNYEPNDAYSEAIPIAPDTYSNMTLCVGDADWFSLSLSNGEVLDAKTFFTHADNDLGMRLYKLNDDGTTTYRAGADTLTDNENLVYQPFDDGTFLLYIYRTRGTTLASYELQLAVSGSPCVEDSFEPNNSYFEAAAIPNGEYIDLTLCVGDSDWYSLEMSNGQVLEVDAVFTHADNDLGLQLYKLNDDGTIT